ncbi:multidrug efflux RND transporter permease subunit [Basilea psittacipulmonis]|uniref:Efflux pump membrane transporter n=1 Tax=Basilea psittacipulmonis DSM 24701 TaxID=1072685 RepID=A0A077DDW3_9BURK|nr:multidrug efflux RND transporter permease subunit [Basilea psittacipulmonis]AIL32809.1 acriflavine resistance protein B [Basilea psittacipulmonis DSM 24701]
MLSQFFIRRPVFSWVIAILITMAGALAVNEIPVAQYPDVAPPTISISTTYPGASAQDVAEKVNSVIEEELNGADGLLYYSSTATSTGTGQIDVTFKPGTDPQLAQVEVQNKVSNVESTLPSEVRAQGLQFKRSNSGFLMVVTLRSANGSMSVQDLGDYFTRNIKNSVSRLEGVGSVQLFGSALAMRVWVDPNKLSKYNLTVAEVASAISAQNAQISGGILAAPPTPKDQTIVAMIKGSGTLDDVKAFENVILKSGSDGATVYLKDVAKVEIGQNSYNFSSKTDGQPGVAFAVSLAPNANALATEGRVQETMKQLAQYFPDGMDYVIPYNTAPNIEQSLEQVMHTLFEAMVLVFIVMFVFLQNIRYTIIPAIVVPVALLGTVAVLYSLGYSVNVLTMFAMVLAIGILVDDAIVVVENVERIMATEHLSPFDATVKAMPQISGAIIGITLALCTVFVPLLFFSGSAGVIYQQFAITIIVSIIFSAFLALTFTPALCATVLKPITDHGEKKGFFGWFNRNFTRLTTAYSTRTERWVTRGGRMMIIWLILSAFMGWKYMSLPTGFIPDEDQGLIMTNIQLNSNASATRTDEVIQKVEQMLKTIPEVNHYVTVRGFSFNGSGLNAGLAFINLKDHKDRSRSAKEIAAEITGKLYFGIPEAIIFATVPPAIMSLGTSSGVDFVLQDRSSMGMEKLRAASNQLLALAQQSPVLTGMRITGLGTGPMYYIDIDRVKATQQGVSISDISTALSYAMGGSYVGTFSNKGHIQNIWVQADQSFRLTEDNIKTLKVKNSSGDLVEIGSMIKISHQSAETLMKRFNSFPAMTMNVSAKDGYSSGDARAELERLVAQLPSGVGLEWTGATFQEVQAGSQAGMMLAMAMIVVFLVLAALYESWAIPVSALLIVPLGMLGTVVLTWLTGKQNDIYFNVGMITIIGLSAKNAILIVEFAKDAYASGKGLVESAIEAAKLRFRPILMTSFAFILGVVPLVYASGAGSAGQNAVGISVIGGMLAATPFSVIFVPTFFVVVMKLFRVKQSKLLRSQENLHLEDTHGSQEGMH